MTSNGQELKVVDGNEDGGLERFCLKTYDPHYFLYKGCLSLHVAHNPTFDKFYILRTPSIRWTRITFLSRTRTILILTKWMQLRKQWIYEDASLALWAWFKCLLLVMFQQLSEEGCFGSFRVFGFSGLTSTFSCAPLCRVLQPSSLWSGKCANTKIIAWK